MRRFFGLIALCLGLATAETAPAQQSETRIALIIANSNYESADFIDLPGAARDAGVMEAALSRAGFDVQVERNLNLVAMNRALSAFENRLYALGAHGVGFLYYAGHGVADTDDTSARNYLIPIGAQISSVVDCPTNAVGLSNHLTAIDRTGASAVVVVIDACRRVRLRGDRGMVAEATPTNTLLAFSASPGQSAADDGRYARILAEEMAAPNQPVAMVFNSVLSRMVRETNGAQRPRFDTGIANPISFVTDAGAAASPPIAASMPMAPAAIDDRTRAMALVRSVLQQVNIGIRRPGGAFDPCQPLRSLNVRSDGVEFVCGNGDPHTYSYGLELDTFGRREVTVMVGRNLQLRTLTGEQWQSFSQAWAVMHAANLP